jgi:hypothetical protein
MELVRISIRAIGSRRGRSVFPEFEAEESALRRTPDEQELIDRAAPLVLGALQLEAVGPPVQRRSLVANVGADGGRSLGRACR